MCLYNLGVPSFNITFPSKSYPPTAPYANLTSHFKKLVKNGLIRSYIVKALLYPQIISQIDKSLVIFRKRLKTSVYVSESNSIDSESDIGEKNLTDSSINDSSDDNDDIKHHSDDVENDDNSSSCSFGFVRFHTGKCSNINSHNDDNDYEEIDIKKERILSTSRKSSITIEKSPDGSFIFCNNSNLNINLNEQRDSLPIYSKPIQIANVYKAPSIENVVHTSSALLNITGLKILHQHQEEKIDLCDYDKRIKCAHMACEDLVNIDDTTAITNPLLKKSLLDERHSMPTLFVGNRFNNSSTTKVYIPTYNDKKNIKLSTKNVNHIKIDNDMNLNDGNDDDDDIIEINSVTTHSSSIDLPAVVPASDEITAELLYNFNDNSNKNNDDNSRGNSSTTFEQDLCDYVEKNIIKPPSMFENNSNRICLSREHSPFLKHLLNSDKKYLNKNCDKTKEITESDESNRNSRSNSMKRCISYQFVNLMYDNEQEKKLETTTECLLKKCICCSSSKCPSPRSSDSGMAGSCTISSPDPPIINKYFDIKSIDNNRTSLNNNLRHSRSSHNFGRFEMIDYDNENNHDSGQFGENVQEINYGDNHLKHNMLELSTSRETIKRKTRSQSAERSNSNENVENSQTTINGIYKTGLYAHWWKKENLPKAMLQDLVLLKRIGWGSGKMECDFNFVCVFCCCCLILYNLLFHIILVLFMLMLIFEVKSFCFI